MNAKSLLLTALVAFAIFWGTDFLIHGVWLMPIYEATSELWRPESEMVKRMPYMLAGQALVAIAFTMLYATFVAKKRSLAATLFYSFGVACIVGGGNLIMYTVQPHPGHLVTKWVIAMIGQCILLGIIVHFLYKPHPNESSNDRE